jgi:iron complex transport system permease protein
MVASALSDPMRSRQLALIALAAGLGLAAFASLWLGAAPVPLHDLWPALMGTSADAATTAIIQEIRLPRTLLAIVVGAALGVAGAALQGLFRNPLADPGLIGVTTGAALAAALFIALAGPVAGLLATYGVMVSAFVGAILASLGVWLVARLSPEGGVTFMLLAGIAINALAGAALGLVLFLADEQETRTITFWTLGSLAGGTWQAVVPAVLVVALASAALLVQGRSLDLLALGESEAAAVGLSVGRTSLVIAAGAALAVAAATAVAGIVGFIGLVAPHIARALVGPRHGDLLPASALLGALLVAGADLVARTVLAPAELPIGIVTSLIGAPVFCALLWRAARRLG